MVKRLFSSKETEKAYAKAFNERRCLRCLAKDHKRSQCREPIRCFKCRKLGHNSGRCFLEEGNKEKEGVIKEREPKPLAKTVEEGRTYARVVAPQNVHTKGKDKEAEPQPNQMEPFMDVRPEKVHVYMPYRQGIPPQNEYLYRTGMVYMVEGQPTADTPARLVRELARVVGWRPEDYQVLEADPTHGAHFQLICPGETCLRNTVWNSPYDIVLGVQVGIDAWDLDYGTHYDPPPFQAWVRMYNLPQHAWNDSDIKKLAIPLGRVTGIAPYGRQAQHFKHITVRLACQDPEQLAKNVQYHDGVRATRVRVELLGWRQWQQGPYPVPQPGWEEEQPPVQPEQPPVQPGPESETTQTNNTHPGNSSSGGSSSVHGPVRGGRQRVCYIKQKLRQSWKERRKEERARKVTQERPQGSIQDTQEGTQPRPHFIVQECKKNFSNSLCRACSRNGNNRVDRSSGVFSVVRRS